MNYNHHYGHFHNDDYDDDDIHDVHDDDFSIDNNPFAGSNHYYSNGILNNSNDNNTDNDKDGDTDDDDDNDDDDDTTTIANDSIPFSISEQPSLYTPNHPISSPSSSSSPSPSPIVIKNFEVLKDFKGTKTIFYKIENNSNNTFTLRRYNDFKSLRSYLCKFYPYLFVPPIPEKHSISRFFKNPFNYKNDISIIQLRIRLLNYFLSKLMSDSILKNSNILKKFLDPLINSWTSCLNSPPFTNLSSNSILLISTRNPTKPSPYFSYLPIPPLNLLKSFDSNLNNSIFKNLDIKLKLFLKIIMNLEFKIKNLIKLLNSLRIYLVELGGFLNIFSIIEHQNFKIEKFGNKIDLNFLNIEILINNLIIKIKEPIIILKNSLIYLIHMLHFRKLKELQLVYFQNIILNKQKRLKNLISSIKYTSTSSNLLVSLNSPSLNLAMQNLKLKDTLNNSTMNNLSSESKNVILQNIKNLNNELNSNLIPCFNFLIDDVSFLSLNVENNVNAEFNQLIIMLFKLLENWKSNVWGEYLYSCIKIWKNNNTHVSQGNGLLKDELCIN